MTTQAEYEAAYFTLLRARDDLEALNRYETELSEEISRLTSWINVLKNHPSHELPKPIRRTLDSSAQGVIDAIDTRIQIARSEQKNLPKRIDAQTEFLYECEEQVERLRVARDT